MRLFIFLTFIFGPLTGPLMAKDLTSRLGVGYASSFISGDAPGISARYYPSPDLGFSASLAVDTKENASQFGFMVKLYKVVFPEDNMNFFMGSGVGLISLEEGGQTNSGFELNAYVGGEYFFTGLESLGFSFEAGVGVASVGSAVRFRTIGSNPLKAGIIFYF